jgi:hypothetical protein
MLILNDRMERIRKEKEKLRRREPLASNNEEDCKV